MVKVKTGTFGKGDESWYKSRRVWGSILTAASAIAIVIVELGYLPETTYVKAGQLIAMAAGAAGVSYSWISPKSK